MLRDELQWAVQLLQGRRTEVWYLWHILCFVEKITKGAVCFDVVQRIVEYYYVDGYRVFSHRHQACVLELPTPRVLDKPPMYVLKHAADFLDGTAYVCVRTKSIFPRYACSLFTFSAGRGRRAFLH